MASGQHHMHNGVVSQLWSYLLEKAGVSAVYLNRRRQLWQQWEDTLALRINMSQSDFPLFYYFLGSQSEGSSTPGMKSDIDLVTGSASADLIEDLRCWIPGAVTFLMVSDEWTPPGYTKLHKVDDNLPMPLYGIRNKALTTDTMNRSVLRNRVFYDYTPGSVLHGPAQTTLSQDLTERDLVFSMIGLFWPSICIPWLNRRRRHNWPSEETIQSVVNHGFIVVPVGDRLSSEHNVEWRISFTLGERELVFQFNKAQMHCYVTLKMIAKTFLNPLVPDCISSYICKTCMFFIIEETDSGLWTTDNVLLCVNMCLKRLSDWVKEGYCPNYFISTRNMLASKVQGLARNSLALQLEQLLEDSRFLLRIEFDDLGQTLAYMCSSYQCYQPPHHMISTWRQKLVKYFLSQSTECLHSSIVSVLQVCNYCNTKLTKILLQYLIDMYSSTQGFRQEVACILVSFVSCIMGSQLASQNIPICASYEGNVIQKTLGVAHMYYLIGTYSDNTSGKLKLAAYYLNIGMTILAETVLGKVEDTYRHDVQSVGFCAEESYIFIDRLVDTEDGMNMVDITRKHIAYNVVYIPSEIGATPPDLIPEMFRCVGTDPKSIKHMRFGCYDWAVVDSAVYLPYLQFQCYRGLGKHRKKQIALNNLAHAVFNRNDIWYKDTAQNILGCCLRQEGRYQEALDVFHLSMWTHSPHNAAKWHILNLLFCLLQKEQ